MITLRNEKFGGMLGNDETGEIYQLNETAYEILNDYVCDITLTKEKLEFLNKNDFFGIENKEKVRIVTNELNSNYLSVPESVIIRITSRCNKNCPGCYENKNGKDIESSQFYKIIDEISELGVFRVQIGGGEPFVNKKIFDYVKYIRNKNLAVSIGTNGTLIDEEIALKLKKIGNVYIQLSLNEPGNESIEEVESIIKKALILKKYQIKHGYNLILTKYNMKYCEKIINMAEKTTPIKIKLLRPKPCSNYKWYEREKIEIYDTEIIEFIKKVLNKYKNVEGDCSLKSLLNEKNNIGCLGATRTMCISENLNYVGCPFFMHNCEKAKDNFQLSKVWRSSKVLNEMREEITAFSGDYDKNGMRKCSVCLLFKSDFLPISKYKQNILKSFRNETFFKNIAISFADKNEKKNITIYDCNNFVSNLLNVKPALLSIETFENDKQLMCFTVFNGCKVIHVNNKYVKTSNPIRFISVLIHEYVHILQVENMRYVPANLNNQNIHSYFNNASEKEAYFIQYILTDYIYLCFQKYFKNKEVIDIIRELKKKDDKRKKMMKI